MKSLFITTLLFLAACINPQNTENKDQVIKAMADAISKKFKDAPQISIEEFQSIKDNIILVDVRSEDEIKVSTIKGAITRKEFEATLNNSPESLKDKKIVSYCTIGERSSEYTIELKKRGLDAFNLKESILGWSQRQLPLVDPNGKDTKKVHVYGEAMNLVPKNYKGVWE